MARERLRQSKGFTVVELIVALSISALTLLSGYELFEVLKRTGDAQNADLAGAADVLRSLDQIREDLLHALPRTSSQEPIFAGGNPSSAPQEKTTKLLEFFSLCTCRDEDRFPTVRQMHQVTYELLKGKDFVGLYRSVTPVAGPRGTSDAGAHELVLEPVEQLQIAFHNGQSFAPSFLSKERLPLGVELTVTAYGRTWPLSVMLPCGASEEQP